MARRNIENIKVGNNPNGKAFGGLIYNLNCNIGQQGESTKVDLEIVSESGTYAIDDQSLNCVNPITITVGDTAKAGGYLVFKSMFPIAYEYSNSLSAKTLKVTFVDGSSILEKIQVVILNKQACPANFQEADWRGFDPTWYIAGFNPYATLWQVPVKCNNTCPSTGFPAWGPGSRNPWLPTLENRFNNRNPSGLPLGAPRPSVAPYTQFGSRAMVTNVDPRNLALGGAIIVGQDDFVSSGCQIANVSYTFADLYRIVNDVLGIPMLNFADMVGFNAPVRESFSGTLKDVLNDWCALFGLGYTWDFGSDSLVAHALNDPQLANDMADLYQIVDTEDFEATTADNPIAVSDITFTKSLEGTYHQDDISTYSKPARKSTQRQEFINRILFAPLTLHSIIPYEEGTAGWNALTGHRTEEELIISSILSKYNQNARTLYNFFIIARKTNDFANIGAGFSDYGRPLGLSLKHKLTDDERNDLLSYTMNIKDYVANSKQYGKDAAAFLGTYSEEKERGWIDWERKIADFIGKYYIFPEEIERAIIRKPNAQFCFDRTVETKPQTEVFQKDKSKAAPNLQKVAPFNSTAPVNGNRNGVDNGESNYYAQDLPFQDILKHPNGAVLPKLVHPVTKETINKFRLHSRNARFGVEEEVHVEPLFYKESQEILKDYIPTFSELDSNAQTFLFEVIKDVFPDIYNELDSLKDDAKKPNLLFFPTKEKIQEVFDVSALTGTPGYMTNNIMNGQGSGNLFNDNEFSLPEEEGDDPPRCELLCDWDLESFLCDCPEGDSFDVNKVGLTVPWGRYIKVTVDGQMKTWILPSEYPFSGYLFVNTTIQKTLPSIQQNYGTLKNAQNTMGYRINFRNITSDIDATDQDLMRAGGNVDKANEGNGQIMASVAIPGRGVMGARQYHLLTQQQYTMSQISKTLRFTVVGLNWLPFAPYMSPASGMTGLNVSYGESGLRLSLEFANRPPVLPDPAKLISRIEPKLNASAYMRTF